jgi:hypothetical protein
MSEPAWLTARVDQRLALMSDSALDAASANLVLTPLTEPDEDASPAVRQRWDRTCDNCRRYCPDDEPFFTGNLVRTWRGTPVIVVFGVCPDCKAG